MAYLYILYSEKLDKYYIGACLKMDRRFREHNIGHSKFTSKGTPWQLIYTEDYETVVEANKREAYIKKNEIKEIYGRVDSSGYDLIRSKGSNCVDD